MEKNGKPGGEIINLDQIREGKRTEQKEKSLEENLDELFEIFDKMDRNLTGSSKNKDETAGKIYYYLINDDSKNLKRIVEQIDVVCEKAEAEGAEDVLNMFCVLKTAVHIFSYSYEGGKFDKLPEATRFIQLMDIYSSIIALLSAKKYFSEE